DAGFANGAGGLRRVVVVRAPAESGKLYPCRKCANKSGTKAVQHRQPPNHTPSTAPRAAPRGRTNVARARTTDARSGAQEGRSRHASAIGSERVDALISSRAIATATAPAID